MENTITQSQQHILDRTLANHGSEYTLMTRGQHNLVAIIGNEVALRMPRDEHAAQDLQCETGILQTLERYGEREKSPLEIPRLIEFHTDPTFMICTVVEGRRRREAEIRNYSAKSQASIGRSLGQFIGWFSRAIPVTMLSDKHVLSGEVASWDEDLVTRLATFDHPAYPDLSAHTTALARDLRDTYIDMSEHQLLGGHDDLHIGNILFVDDALSGVIDFGDIRPTVIERELRHAYALGSVVLEAAIAELHDQGFPSIDPARIRLWLGAHQASGLCAAISNGTFGNNPYSQRDIWQKISRWYPERKWGELRLQYDLPEDNYV